jgi:hypothetical protein
MIVIDGHSYAVNAAVTELTESFEKLSSDKSGRTKTGDMYISLIGVYFNYELKLYKGNCSIEDWDRLWDQLSAKKAFNTITVPHNQTTVTFVAYITSGSRMLKQQRNDKNYWGDITVKFIAKSPQNLGG